MKKLLSDVWFILKGIFWLITGLIFLIILVILCVIVFTIGIIIEWIIMRFNFLFNHKKYLELKEGKISL
jgi:hypothetical protein